MRIAACRFCGADIQEEPTAFGVMWFHKISKDQRTLTERSPDRRQCFTVASPDLNTMTLG
jgi:hypothetical protein